METVEAHSPNHVRERAAGLIRRALFLSLLLLLALTAIPYGTVEPWWIALFECVIFALAAIWAVDEFLSGAESVKTLPLLLPLFTLSVYAYVQTLPLVSDSAQSKLLPGAVWAAISADPYQTRLLSLKLLALTLGLALFARYTSSVRRLQALIWMIILLAVASALFGMVRQTTQHEAPGFVLPYLKGGYGQFINKNHFAFLMEMALGLMLGIVVGRGVGRGQKLIYLGLALPVWTGLVLSNSRGGLFAMLAQILFLGFLTASSPSKRESEARERSHTITLIERFGRSVFLRGALLVCLVIMLFVGAIWMGGEPLVTSLENVPGEVRSRSIEETDGASRSAIWRATWQLIKDHPIAGVGFGGYWAAIPQFHQASGQVTPQEAHNDYLELMASGGFIGVGVFGWFLVVFIRRARARLRRTSGFVRASVMGALTGLFGVAVHSFVDFGLHITINAFVCMALLAIAACDVGEGDVQATSLKPRY